MFSTPDGKIYRTDVYKNHISYSRKSILYSACTTYQYIIYALHGRKRYCLQAKKLHQITKIKDLRPYDDFYYPNVINSLQTFLSLINHVIEPRFCMTIENFN